MTRQQRRKLNRELNNEKVLVEGVHVCSNGESFDYKVTNLDKLRREFTGSFDCLEGLRNGTIQPLEISILLEKLYGKYETFSF